MTDPIADSQPSVLFHQLIQDVEHSGPIEENAPPSLPETIKTQNFISTSEIFLLSGSGIGGGAITAAITIALALPLLSIISLVAFGALVSIALTSLTYHCWLSSTLQQDLQIAPSLLPPQPQPNLPLIGAPSHPDNIPSNSENPFMNISSDCVEAARPLSFLFQHTIDFSDNRQEIDPQNAISYTDEARLIDQILRSPSGQELAFTWTPDATGLPDEAANAVLHFPKKRQLPTPAVKFDEPPPAPEDKEINSDLAMQLIQNYEQWMRDIAKEDFLLDLPPPFVKKKFSEFLAAYSRRIDQALATTAPDNFISDVLRPIYEHLQSEESRRGLVEEFYLLKQSECAQELPRNLIREVCGELSKEPIEHMFSIAVEELEQNLTKYFATPSMSGLAQIEKLRAKIYLLANAKELLNLHHQLLASLGESGKTIADSILNSWDFIGIDIRNQQNILRQSRKDLIIEKATKALQEQGEPNEALHKLSQDLHEILPAAEPLLTANYSSLEAFIKAIPASNEEELQLMLNRSIIHHELENQANDRSDESEETILKQLNYHPVKTLEPSKIQFCIEVLLKGILSHQDGHTRSPLSLKKAIDQLFLQKRLQAAGVEENRQANVQSIIQELASLKKQLQNLAESELQKVSQELLEEGLSIKTINHFISMQRKKLSRTVKEEITTFFANHASSIRSCLDLPTEAFQNRFHQSIQDNVLSSENCSRLKTAFCIDLEKISQAILWYQAYEHTFMFPLKSGEDDLPEALSNEISSAWVNRLMIQSIKTPGWHLKGLGASEIMPIDLQNALKQIQCKNAAQTDAESLLIPQQILAKQGLKEAPLFLATLDTVKDAIIESLSSLEESSHGWLKIHLRNQVVGICVDTENKKFFFIDPNFGIQQFKLIPRQGQSREQAKRDSSVIEDAISLMVDSFVELLQWCYDDTTTIRGYQLQALLPGEIIPEDFYQFEESQIFC